MASPEDQINPQPDDAQDHQADSLDHAHAHDHDAHGHGHAHGPDAHGHFHGPVEPLNVDELDPANRSLAEALRISFSVLRLVMVVLVIAFAFSGLREVKQGQVGLRLHFGAVQGRWAEDPQTGQRELVAEVLQPGWHLAWPEPLDRIIVVPITDQQVDVNEAFWFNEREGEQALPLDEKTVRGTSLTPGVDGSLITGDKNIVHAQWTITYHIDPQRVEAFVRNVGIGRPGQPAADGNPLVNAPETALYWADRMVSTAAQEALVHITATTAVDDFVKGTFDRVAAARLIQATLDTLDSGIAIDEVLLNNPTPPLAVRPDFQAVGIARSNADQKREQAQRMRSRILNEVAGQAYEPFIAVIDFYEQANELAQPDQQAAAEQAIVALLDGQPASEALQPVARFEQSPPLIRQIATDPAHALASARISGEASSLISQAQSYRTGVVAELEAEVRDFNKRHAEFRGDPQLERITRHRLWQDMRQRVFTGDVERFYLPPSPVKTIYLEAGRDPRIQERREQQQSLRRIEQGAPAP